MRYFHKTMGPEDVKKYQGGGPKVWKRVAGFEGGSKSRRGVQKTLKQRSLPDKEFLFLMEKKEERFPCWISLSTRFLTTYITLVIARFTKKLY